MTSVTRRSRRSSRFSQSSNAGDRPPLAWEKTFGKREGESDVGNAAQQTADGGYILAGWTAISGVGGSIDAYLIKTDPEGNVEWDRTYDGGSHVLGHSVQQTADGGYILAGQKRVNRSEDVYLAKVDPEGNLEWEKTFGGAEDEIGDSVQQTDDGGYAVAGETRSFGAGSSDFYLLKTDPFLSKN